MTGVKDLDFEARGVQQQGKKNFASYASLSGTFAGTGFCRRSAVTNRRGRD